MADFHYEQFLNKDANHWQHFKDYSAEATQGVNKMPYVMNGYNGMAYANTPAQTHSWLYPGSSPAPAAAAAPAIDPSLLQQLLGLAATGGVGTQALFGSQ